MVDDLVIRKYAARRLYDATRRRILRLGDIAELIDKIRQQSDLFNSSHMHVCSMHTKYAHAFVSEDYFFIF